MFHNWIAALEERHLADLTFSEVSRALRALSSTYVERRQKLSEGAALSGAGKRAAFALFYGPLHFLLVREIVRALAPPSVDRIVDLGCGTGASGAGWADAQESTKPEVLGVDRHPWALQEAAWTYRLFGIRSRTVKADVSTLRPPRERSAVLAAFTLNELAAPARDTFVIWLLERHRPGEPILIVEPLARAIAPWWATYRQQFEAAGGRSDEWRVRVDLPPIVTRLDRAAGLDHRELTGRSLWLP